MKNLSLVLALCAFIAAPAFADDHAASATTATEAATTTAAPAKHGKMAKKGKHGKMHAAKKGAADAAPAASEPAHQ
ncbi:MAG: hypothetical protein ACXWQO_07525 [Bdellovibrionota bacterium]